MDYGLVAITSLEHVIVLFRVRWAYVWYIGYALACRKGGRYSFKCNMQKKEKKNHFPKCSFILPCYRVFSLEESKAKEGGCLLQAIIKQSLSDRRKQQRICNDKRF